MVKISKVIKSPKWNFYSDDMFITKGYLVENHLKLTYQRQLISNLDSKHKYWSKNIGY